jgi:hypothetical protein
MTDSKNFPILRNCDFVCIRLGKILSAKGHLAIEFSLGSHYLPCKNPKDSFYGACESPTGGLSYYRTFQFRDDGTNDWPSGIFISNVDKDKSGSSSGDLTHDWAKRLVSVSVEIYSHTQGVGYARFDYAGAGFTHPAHNCLYSIDLGDIELPQEKFYKSPPDGSGRYKVARINGYVTNGGRAIDGNIVQWRIFGGKGQTSGGYPISGFRIFSNSPGIAGSKGGYYDSGPVYPGNYRCELIHQDASGKRIKSVVKNFDIDRPFERVDIPLDNPSFWS